MDLLNQNAKLDLKCPNCGHKFKKTIGGMQSDFHCPDCGTTFKTNQIAKDMKAVEKTLKDFARKISKLSK